jgi:membrane protease YdiL (CAAX protease family)
MSFIRSGPAILIGWILSSLVLAAVIVPWLYQGGMWLAGEAAAKDLPGVLEWLGAAAGRSAEKYGRYYDRSLALSAVLLLAVFRPLMKGAEPGHIKTAVSWKTKFWADVAVGFLLAAGLLWGLGIVLDLCGAYQLKDPLPPVAKVLRKTLIPAVAAPLIEEWLFRGLLLGMWLRYARPAWACLGTSLVFAFVHFLKPMPGTTIVDPTAPTAGFELLAGILRHFLEPRFFFADFVTLLVVGLILAWTKVRTGRLLLAIGLHAGWVAAFKAYNLLHTQAARHDLIPWGVGDSLRSGLLPMLTLLVTAGLVFMYLEWVRPRLIRASP